MAKQNMRLVTTNAPLIRHSLPPAQESLLDPNNTPGTAPDPLYLLDGEWLGFNDDYKFAREGAANAASGGDGTLAPSAAGAVSLCRWYPFWMERGRTDMRAIAEGRCTVILGGACWEADFTEDVLAAADISGGFNVGDALYVNWLSAGADINRRRGLTKVKNAGDAGFIHGFVTRVYSSGSTYAIRAIFH